MDKLPNHSGHDPKKGAAKPGVCPRCDGFRDRIKKAREDRDREEK